MVSRSILQELHCEVPLLLYEVVCLFFVCLCLRLYRGYIVTKQPQIGSRGFYSKAAKGLSY